MQLKSLVHSAGKIGYFVKIQWCRAEGASAPPNVLICRKFGYRDFDTFVYYWVIWLFLRKKNFWSSASVRTAEHEKSSCHFQASVHWFEAKQRL